jgi:hypothetical protein
MTGECQKAVGTKGTQPQNSLQKMNIRDFRAVGRRQTAIRGLL